MGILYRSHKLCLFWHATRPFTRLCRGVCAHSTDSLMSNYSSKFNAIRNTRECHTNSLVMNNTSYRILTQRQTRTLSFSHSQRLTDKMGLTLLVPTRKLSKTSITACKSTIDESSDVNNRNTPAETQGTEGTVPDADWIHPSSRADSIVKKDSELKSILHEMASDFGKDASSKSGVTETDEDQGIDSADESEDKDDKNFGNTVSPNDIKRPTRSSGRHVEPAARKANGVLSLADVVKILREDNAQDICVIKVPKEQQYVDYFVIVTGRSTRHIKAMTAYLNKVYKMLRRGGEPFLKIEGKNSDDWMCVDFGDIVVHFMLPETRELYELEMLWTLGPEYDDQYQRMVQYQATVNQPSVPTETELEDLKRAGDQDDGYNQIEEGYSVVILDEGEIDIPDEKRI